MATLTSELLVRLVDGVSGPARVAARSLALLQKAGTWATAEMQTAASTKAIKRNMRGAVREFKEAGDAASMPMMILGALGANAAFEFEKAGNAMQALGEATAEQRKDFEAFANTLNAKYPQSLTEIVKTQTELMKAGLNFQQAKGALDAALAAATLEEMKPSEVAMMLSSALNSFQLPKETYDQAVASTTKIADLMSYAAVKTTASLKDMGEMFKYVGGAAAATGSTIEDVTAIAMAFAANKVVGSEAGVALRSAIIRLAKGLTKEGKAAMARAGLNLANYSKGAQKVTTDRILGGLLAGGIDASDMRKQIDALVNDPTLATAPLKLAAKVTALLQEHFKSNSAMDASVIAENVQDSITAAGAKIDLMKFFEDIKQKLAKGSLTMGDVSQILEGRHFARYAAVWQAVLGDLLKQVEKEAPGFLARTYPTMLQGIVGPVYNLTAALEKLSVVLGRSVFRDAAGWINRLADGVDKLTKVNPSSLNWTVKLGLGLAALAPAGIALGVITSAINGFRLALMGLAGGVALVTGAPVWTVVTAILGIGAAVAAAYVYWDKIKDFAGWLGDLAMGFQKWELDFSRGMWSALDTVAADLYNAGANLMDRLWEGMKAKAQSIVDWVRGLGASISGAVGGWLGGGAKGGAASTPPGRAAGGSVTGGRPYVVGERGPELFVPGASGRIMPNGGAPANAGPVTIHMPVTFNGVRDAEDVKRILRDEVRQLFRGLQSDTGLVFA